MARKQDAPRAHPVTAADVDPRHRWDRPLQAPGHTQVDFEERVDFHRLHAYRLGRARQALAHSGLGALLDRTAPRLAVISVGAHNPYGHPTAGTLATLAAHGIPTMRTDEGGDVTIDVDRGGWTVEGG